MENLAMMSEAQMVTAKGGLGDKWAELLKVVKFCVPVRNCDKARFANSLDFDQSN